MSSYGHHQDFPPVVIMDGEMFPLIPESAEDEEEEGAVEEVEDEEENLEAEEVTYDIELKLGRFHGQ